VFGLVVSSFCVVSPLDCFIVHFSRISVEFYVMASYNLSYSVLDANTTSATTLLLHFHLFV